MTFDLYVWARPRDLDAERAAELIREWESGGGDPVRSPFEQDTSIGWFHRELTSAHPSLEVVSDAMPSGSRIPIWMSPTNQAPARIAAIRLPRGPEGSEAAVEAQESLADIYSLAIKYDLLLLEPSVPRIRRPQEEMSAYASADFWPRGAIRAAIAGIGGAILAVVAWFLGIPILSGVLIVIGVFLALLSIGTFAFEARSRPRPGQGSETEG